MDSGNLTNGAGVGKLDVIASAMAKIGYAAVGVGELDARLGADFFATMAAHKIAVVDTSPATDKSAVPFLLKTVGGVKVGVVSFGAALPNVTVDDMELRKKRFEVFKEARAKSDVLIVLDQAGVATREWIDRNGPRLGAPDIVIRGFGGGGNDNEDVVARSHIMPAMNQARQIGVIDLELVAGQEPKVYLRRVTLDDQYAEEPQIRRQIDDAMAALVIPATETPHGPGDQIGSAPKPVYSNKLCKACHLPQYEDWVTTKHAVAIKTLADQNKDTPECLPCHSERYRATRQHVAPQDGIGGVDCATCHAASLPHGMERRQMAVRVKVEPAVCLQCHTKDRSPSYDEKTFFPKVAHKITSASTTASAPASH